MDKDRITRFDKRSHALKTYAAGRWGEEMPCPLRLVANPYKGCGYHCKHCYVWSSCRPKAREGFAKALPHNIARAKREGFGGCPVIMSPSTDPLQPLELKEQLTLFALRELLAADFQVIVMTRNPSLLLEKQYLEMTLNERLFVDVSIPSITEGDPRSIFVSGAPSVNERLIAIGRLSDLGKYVRVKIDPIVPSLKGLVSGQTEQDLWELVGLLKEAGCRMVVAKTLRMNDDVPANLCSLLEYYKANGIQEGINWVLPPKIRRGLLRPLVEACRHHGVLFCPCV